MSLKVGGNLKKLTISSDNDGVFCSADKLLAALS